MAVNPFPSYLEVEQPLPIWFWHSLRAGVLVGAVALVVVLFVRPHEGLIAWWLFVLPCIPMLLVLAPGIWRNLCPMATLNQYPRLFGFTRGRTVPDLLRRRAYLIQVTFYFALISTRAPIFDHNGTAVGALMIVALGAAFAGGVAFKGKSGWCGTLCPLMPVQRLYGQTPLLVVPNSHCKSCVGCTPNCLDFNPQLAVVADVEEGDEERVNQLKFFAAAFPGFVVAFFTVPNSVVGSSADIGVSVGRFYLLTAAYMLVSLGAFYVVDMLGVLSPLVLMAAFGAIGLNLHNILRFPTAFHFSKPPWLLAVEYAVVVALTLQFVVRTYRKERQVAGLLLADGDRAELTVRPGAGVAAAATRGDGASHEVSFEPDGPRVVANAGTTLLDVAERADLPLEVGCRMGVCGADPIRIMEGADHLSPATPGELSTLERLGLGGGCRMACSARVSGDVCVSLDLSQAERDRSVREVVEHDPAVTHVVIVGNGIAGVTAADHVRRRHPECSIDLIGDEAHSSYNRMGISRLVYGNSAMTGLRLLPEDWYEKSDVTCWLNTLVDEIDREEQQVTLGTGEKLPYSRLILAMGARSSVPPLEGVDLRGVFVLRTADDAINIRGYAQRHRCRRAAVVGGGLLGLEAAFALHKLGLRVTVVQRSKQLLFGQLDARAGELLERYFLGLGIGIVLGATPVAVENDGGRTELVLGDGNRIDVDLVAICTGIQPNVDLAVAAGLDVDRGVLVDDHMRSSDPLIYAAGDVAQFDGQVYGLWPVASAQAEVAAANATGDDRSYDPQPPVAILKGVGLAVTSIGDVDGAADGEQLVRQSGEDEIRYWKLNVRDERLVGAVLLGHWPEAPSVVDAVASHADVSEQLDALRTGDLSVLART